MTDTASLELTRSTPLELARKMVDLCREGRNDEALDTLFSDDMISIKAGVGSKTMPREMHGRDAAKAKGKWWMDNHEIHSATITGPWPNDDRFIVGFEYDITQKATGHRFAMTETGLYTVLDGKIIREEFFYHMG